MVAKPSASFMRWINVLSWRRSMRLKRSLRTRMLAREAATASLISNVTRCSSSTRSCEHYNESIIDPTVTPATVELVKVAEAEFPSRFGRFRIYGFEGHDKSGVEEAVVLAMGDLHHGPMLVRVHSQCFTGDVLHSLPCDCR